MALRAATILHSITEEEETEALRSKPAWTAIPGPSWSAGSSPSPGPHPPFLAPDCVGKPTVERDSFAIRHRPRSKCLYFWHSVVIS